MVWEILSALIKKALFYECLSDVIYSYYIKWKECVLRWV